MKAPIKPNKLPPKPMELQLAHELFLCVFWSFHRHFHESSSILQIKWATDRPSPRRLPNQQQHQEQQQNPDTESQAKQSPPSQGSEIIAKLLRQFNQFQRGGAYQPEAAIDASPNAKPSQPRGETYPAPSAPSKTPGRTVSREIVFRLVLLVNAVSDKARFVSVLNDIRPLRFGGRSVLQADLADLISLFARTELLVDVRT